MSCYKIIGPVGAGGRSDFLIQLSDAAAGVVSYETNDLEKTSSAIVKNINEPPRAHIPTTDFLLSE